MTDQSRFSSLLVPTDLSDMSRDAFQWAVRHIDGDESVILVLHVVDQHLVDTIAEYEFAPRDEVSHRMRNYAQQRLDEFQGSREIRVDTIVSEGLPFLEIIRKADDFAVDAIVMGRVSTRGQFEKLLFGSTAEKVLRGARHPVIVLPQPNPR